MLSTQYVKPNNGSRGLGIYKIETDSNGYFLKSTKKTNYYNTIDSIYQYLLQKSRRSMIIQQGIILEKMNGRPYDIRVMIQRKPNKRWTCTGLFCKVGRPKKIVTNYYQGGELRTLINVFNRMKLSERATIERKKALSNVALVVARTLSAKQSGMYQMGVDLAYDMNGNIRIIEVNSRHPAFYPLKKLNYKMYKRMLNFAYSYGRKRP